MRKILVTGGAGFIGSCLVDKLLENEDNYVVAVDNLITGVESFVPKANDRFKFIKCDVNDWKAISPVMSSYSFDYVFHYAALVGVKRTLQNPVMVLQDLDGMKNVLELCKATGVKRIFFSSSSEVYGEPVELPQNEQTTPLNSRLPYAVVKNVGESFCRSYHQEYGLDYTIFRFFNTYGSRQSEDFVMSKFINAARANEPITVYGDGNQSRTFCYINDNIDATVACLYKDQFINDVINVGNDSELPIIELARTIIEATGSTSQIEHLPPLPEGDMTRRWPDVSKMKSLLERELTSLKGGIEETVKLRFDS